MSSVPCACRDCFDIATSGPEMTPALCPECEDAGCERSGGDGNNFPAHHYDCQREPEYEPHPRVWPNYIDNP